MKQVFPDVYCWSVFNEDRQIDFNGHLWVREEGNVLFDPVPMIESDLAQLDRLGGAAWIVVTNRDHEREAGAFRERTGARVIAHEADAASLAASVDRPVREGEILPGLWAVRLEHGKSPGEIALHWPEREVVLAGDLVVGAPVGRLSLLGDEKLDDAPAAARECRKLLALPFDAMLVGDGHSLVTGAREQLLRCLEARTDIHINHIDAGEVPWVPYFDREGYRWESKDLDPLVGARRLGYELLRLPPGQSTCPYHLHHFGEELFVVLEGECNPALRPGLLARARRVLHRLPSRTQRHPQVHQRELRRLRPAGRGRADGVRRVRVPRLGQGGAARREIPQRGMR